MDWCAEPPRPADLDAVDANKKFGVLRSWATGPYLVGGGTSMMGDSIEHVLSYWVLWETFHSPALVGFQLISHWTPFLLLSTWAGALAERYDCRRIIQIAQALFISVSLGWGILFLTGTLQLWHAVILLIVHGMAGALWGPAEQMMLYDFAGPKALPSAIRINATFRSLGFLLGPVVGSALLLTVGAAAGMFINVAFYLPLTIYLIYTPYTGHQRNAAPKARVGFLESFKVLGTVRRYPAIFAVLLIAALSSVTVGAVLQNVMPVFANILNPGADVQPGSATARSSSATAADTVSTNCPFSGSVFNARLSTRAFRSPTVPRRYVVERASRSGEVAMSVPLERAPRAREPVALGVAAGP